MKAIFDYPKEFTSLPEYSAHRGQIVEVGEYHQCADPSMEGMYEITADDGWKGHAFESEIRSL